MSRVVRARRIATTAAYGGGSLGAIGASVYGLLRAEARIARRSIGTPFGIVGPAADGVYGSGSGRPLRLAMLGDSSAVGLGADEPGQTPGAVIASGLASLSGRPVQLRVVGVVGAESTDLEEQVDGLLADQAAPDVAVVMVGVNDVTHRISPAVAVRALDAAVRRLRVAGTEVIVGTCPDLGTVRPIPHPLRLVCRRWSRQLAAAQTIAVVEAGGRTVSLGDLLGPEFAANRGLMFSADGFHPSAAGYAQAAAAIIPAVADSLGAWPRHGAESGVGAAGAQSVARAAVRAADQPGSEVTAAPVRHGRRGPLAVVLRRRHPATILLPEDATEVPATTGSGTDRPAVATATAEPAKGSAVRG